MRYIRKGAEPQALLEYRLTSHASYDGLPQEVKDELRERLAREQGFLCCYCMQRIRPEANGMKIEHWAPQSDPATHSRQLDWKNLLGACKGGEASAWKDQHCDTRKADTPLKVNPTDEGCERLVRFLADGTVESDDPTIHGELDRTLNLNHARLRHNRKATLDAFVQAMRKKNPNLTWTDADMERELKELAQADSSGRLGEYCQVPIFWLKKRMGRRNRPGP